MPEDHRMNGNSYEREDQPDERPERWDLLTESLRPFIRLKVRHRFGRDLLTESLRLFTRN